MTPLLAYNQWIVVKLVPLANGKAHKLPIDPRTSQVTEKGSDGAHNPAIWLSYQRAAEHAQRLGGNHTVGFVLTAADPFFCLDIDGARMPDGTWSPFAQQLCAALPGCTVEVSQSGNGLHIWGQGPVPEHSKKNVPLHIELYTSLRFIAIGTQQTGTMQPQCPGIAAVAAQFFPPRATRGDAPDEGPRADWRGPEDDNELLRRAMQSRSAAAVFGSGTRATFADLYHADIPVLAAAYPADSNSLEPYDRSSADAALFQHLAFWTGCDAARMRRLADGSALKRDKWENRDDYLDRTIGNACAQQRDVLVDKPTPTPPAPVDGAPMPMATARQGATILSPAQQVELFTGCVYVVDAHRALIPGGKLVRPDQFRAIYGGRSFVMDASNARVSRNAWEAFTESQMLDCPQADGTCFRPKLPFAAMVHDAGRKRVNTYWPVKVPRKRGDTTPFLRHLSLILPNPRDAQITLAYLAALVQHQGKKFPWAIVLQGVEGNGKTLLSHCVAEAIGHRYVHWPKASKLAGNFNGWMLEKTFFPVEDIHTSESRVDVIEELKPMITGGAGLEIEKKGIDQISTEICGNFLFNTNHATGLRKTRNDRRFCWMATAQQCAEDLARDGMTEAYMKALWHWLENEDGFAIVAEFLWTYRIPTEFDPAGSCTRAPHTSSTDAAIAAGLGRVEQEILEAVDQGLPGFAGGWISSTAFDTLLEKMGRAGVVAQNKRREMLQSLGYDWHPALGDRGQVSDIVQPDNRRPKLYVTKDHPSLVLVKPADVAKAYTAAQKA